MEDIGRFERKHKKKKLRRAAAAALAGLLLLLILANALTAKPLEIAAEESAKRVFSRLLNDSFLETMRELSSSGLTEGLTREQTGADGISFLYIDSARLSVIASSVVSRAQEKLQNVDTITVSLTAGTMSRIALLDGRGAAVRAGIEPLGAVTSRFSSRFEAAGVNQTRYTAELELTAELRVMIGASANTVTVSCSSPVCEAIVIGGVPNAYTDVSNMEDALNLIPTEAD
ncbi:MAG: sporulation protein YunB [Clostridia bacterium]|nr:sporulation protein YunB [Clostridia bacterium]